MYDIKGVKVISRILTTNEFQCEFGDNIQEEFQGLFVSILQCCRYGAALMCTCLIA